MANEVVLGISIRADGSIAVKQIDEVDKAIDRLDKSANRGTRGLQSVEKGSEATGRQVAGMAQHLGHASHGAQSFFQQATAMATGMLMARAVMVSFNAVYASTVGLFEKGIKSIDDLRLAQAAMASAAATTDHTRSWKEIYATAGKVVEKVYELDRAFIGTGDELLMLADSMTTFGMGIDVSTKKAQDQFVAFGNLIKMVTKGQDFQRQAYQEVRALMEGQHVQGALIVTKLAAAGVNVRQMIPAWRDQGVLLERIMEHLSGYAQGSREIEKTLAAQKSTLETIAYKILREAFLPAYGEVTGLVKGINDSLMDQNGLTERGLAIVQMLQLGWDAVATAAKIAASAVEKVAAPLGWIHTRWKEIALAGGINVAPVEGAWAEPGEEPWEEAFGFTPRWVAARKSLDQQSAEMQEALRADREIAVWQQDGGSLTLPPGGGMGDAAMREAEARADKLEKLEREYLNRKELAAAGELDRELVQLAHWYDEQHRTLVKLGADQEQYTALVDAYTAQHQATRHSRAVKIAEIEVATWEKKEADKLALERAGREASIADQERAVGQRMQINQLAEKAGYLSQTEGIRRQYEGERQLLELQSQRILLKYEENMSEAKLLEILSEYSQLQKEIAESKTAEVYDLDVRRLELQQEITELQKQQMASVYDAQMQYARGGVGEFGEAMATLTGIEAGQDPYRRQYEQFVASQNDMITKLEEAVSIREERLRQNGMTELEIARATAEQKAAIAVAYGQYDVQVDAMIQQQKAAQMTAYMSIAQNIGSALISFSDRNAKAQFVIAKAVAVAMALVQAHVAAIGAAAAVASIPYVGPALAAAAYAKWMMIGYINAALIAATAIGQLASGRGAMAGGGGALGGGGGTPSLPAAPAAQAGPAPVTPNVNIHIYGNVVDQDKFAREIVPAIAKAIEDGAQ